MALASFRTCFLFIHETLAQRVSRGVRRDGKKIFRRIVMEIRYTGVTLSFADFSPNLNASFALCSPFDLSLSLALFRQKQFYFSASSFFLFFCFVEFRPVYFITFERSRDGNGRERNEREVVDFLVRGAG